MKSPNIASAKELAANIRNRDISCVELLSYFLDRIDRFNPSLNAVVVDIRDRALEEARRLDAEVAAGTLRGALHGVPMTIKESFNITGCATTWGNPAWKDNIAASDAEAVRRMKSIGVNLHGKTNVPLSLADFQSYNEIYGTTNNPYALDRTPGGSSGGSAVALAAGLTGIEAGSDIGGSIRNPSHFCGIFGHKPTWNLLSMRGHSGPGDVRTNTDISVIGPMARSAHDLEVALKALAGPDDIMARGYSLNLPEFGDRDVSSLRVAVWSDDLQCPVSADVRKRVEAVGQALSDRGARVDVSARPAFDAGNSHDAYQMLLQSTMASRLPEPLYQALLDQAAKYDPNDQSEAARVFRQQTARFRDWAGANETRQQLRWAWHEFFERYDVLIAPVSPTAAFPQDQRNFSQRTLHVDNLELPYFQQVFWAGLTGVALLPSTVIPTGLDDNGLPIGVQIVGPEYGDLITIQLAQRLEDDGFRFVPPPAFGA
ncbi:MAG: amidase [Pseudomonadales bacterium]|nr:amidase [Pseudomonadales bacterium]